MLIIIIDIEEKKLIFSIGDDLNIQERKIKNNIDNFVLLSKFRIIYELEVIRAI